MDHTTTSALKKFDKGWYITMTSINESQCQKKYLRYVRQAKIQRVGLGGSVGCAVRLETRRSRVQPPPRSATFFRGDDHEIFSMIILSLLLIQEGQLSASGEKCAQYWLTA